MPRIGQLNRRLLFQQRAVSVRGQRLGDWEQPGLHVWGKVLWLPRRAGEEVLQGRLQNQAPAVLTVRDSRDMRQVTTAWRVSGSLDGRRIVFNIRDLPSPPTPNGFCDVLVQVGVDD